MAWCEAKIIEPTKEIKESKSGTPQGGVLSPLLANMVLKVIKEATPKELILIRYADDFVIFGETREEIENVQEKIKETISKVGLRIHETKTRIVNMRENDISNETGIEFLGMRIRSGKFKSVLIQPRDSALAKFKEKCEFLLGESQVMPASIEKALKDGGHIPDLQEYLGGWSEYF